MVGVDIAPQPHYPFQFHQADALAYLDPEVGIELGDGLFDVIHASPPCQAYVGLSSKDGRHPELIEPVRALLRETGLLYVIENVEGAPLIGAVRLRGSSFGLTSAGTAGSSRTSR